jgi:ketosteroid isomerase-like protein
MKASMSQPHCRVVTSLCRRQLANCTLIAIAILPATVASAATMSQADTDVLAAEAKRFDALIQRDVETVNRLMADDLTYTHSSGVRQNKAQVFSLFSTGKIVYKSVETSDQHVQVVGDVGIITGTIKLVYNDGADHLIDSVYTDVYVKRDGRWQLLAWQSTPRPKQ